MSHETISEHKCPKCGASMIPGYIAGHWIRLRWCEEKKTKTIFAGTPLMKKHDMWNSPTVDAMRCTSCKIGIFSYDN